jgi:hypothetical protein
VLRNVEAEIRKYQHESNWNETLGAYNVLLQKSQVQNVTTKVLSSSSKDTESSSFPIPLYQVKQNLTFVTKHPHKFQRNLGMNVVFVLFYLEFPYVFAKFGISPPCELLFEGLCCTVFQLFCKLVRISISRGVA